MWLKYALILTFLLFMGCTGQTEKSNIIKKTKQLPSISGHGMVSTAHPLATEAGTKILKKGGNAFDAAVAIAATLNVVEPMMSGIGGYGTILIYDAEKEKIRFLDSSGRIPQAVDSDVFRKPNPNYLKNRRGAKAVSTPGNVNAWEAMSKEYGKLEWDELFESAIKIAQDGFVISKGTARMIKSAFNSFPEYAKGFYGQAGNPLKAGSLLKQEDLASSLKQIADKGAKAVYGGKIGQAIDKEMKRSGGFLSLDDLIADRAEWWKPIHITYRDCEVYTASPPATAFPSLIRLGMMSRFDTAKLGHNTTAYLHRFAEVTKYAFWCRLKYAGDPDIDPPPLDKLLSESFWEEEAAKMNLDKAKRFEPPKKELPQGKNTTHFVVADRWGNIVCATQTLGNVFGSRIMPKGTGIWLNNSLAYCTFEPKGNPMDAHAGQRKLSGDCPTIIMREGKPWVAVGTPGGHTIGQTVPQIVMNLIDFKMNIQAAIAAPRVSFKEPDLLLVEEGINKEVLNKLKSKGHKIRVLKTPEGIGNAHGLSIEYDAEGNPLRFFGGTDPRGEEKAAGITDSL